TGRPRLLMLRVTAHANVLTGDNYFISADYFGVTRSLLEKAYGCPVMITQGSAGNVRPRYQQSDAEYLEIHARDASMEKVSPDTVKRRFDESMEALDKMAAEILGAVDIVIKDLKPRTIDRIDMFSENAVCSSEVPAFAHAFEIADEARREAAIDGSRWLAEVERLHQSKVHQQEADVEIQYFIVNNGCWCGTASEAMCEIALAISAKADHGLIYFGGYTNGCNSYLPTAEEFRKGGFEVLWAFLLYYQYHGRVMPFHEDTADRLVEMVAHQWNTYHLT
ncbi:MAG TPA: hypothetical protein VHR47_08860, partial [Bacillota bacterium]|nr:hypothetical protein [Bacillota bacterium]